MSGLSGIILAGGESKRMGHPKGMLSWDGKPLISHLSSVLECFCNEVLISGDPAIYEGTGYTVLPDQQSGRGPLEGILTCLRQTKSDRAIVLACDLPLINPSLVRSLLSANPEGDILVPANAALKQTPLFGVFSKAMADFLENYLDSGRRSFQGLLECSKVCYLEIPNSQAGLFANINTPEDYARLMDMLEVQVKYFGMIAEKTGITEETFRLDPGTSTSALSRMVADQYPELSEMVFKVALNQEILNEDQKLTNHDEVALLPPYAGG